MKRAITMKQLYNKKRKVISLNNEFEALIGKPELKGSWIIWGDSGNGKTSFAIQLAKHLTEFAKVAYNSKEEGDSQSLELTCRREQMEQVASRFVITEDSYDELMIRAGSKRSPDIYIIDSLQYLEINYKKYKQLKEAFPKKLFIFISHAEGSQPEGRLAKKVKYDAFVKIYVNSYTATAISRYGGGQPYIIWKEKAQELLNEDI